MPDDIQMPWKWNLRLSSYRGYRECIKEVGLKALCLRPQRVWEHTCRLLLSPKSNTRTQGTKARFPFSF